MRAAPLLLALALAACASPETEAPAPPAEPPPTEAAQEADGPDIQAWLAEARAIPDTAGFETRRRYGLSLKEHVDWTAACDGRAEGEPADSDTLDDDDPTRGVVWVDDLGDGEALVSVLCFLGAYQGPSALVHIDGPNTHVLSAPALDATGRPLETRTHTFISPDSDRFAEGTLETFAKARGLGDCGTLVRYAHEGAGVLSVAEVRQRECGDDIPDDLPPPEAWPVVYTAR